jgi:aminodeoxyfutalosine deaminase
MMNSESQKIPNPALYRARWVLPVESPPIEDGAVIVRGLSIDAVGPYKDLKRNWPDQAVVDLGEAVLLPGLINCHTHLDNAAFAGQTPVGGGDMISWIEAHQRAAAGTGAEERKHAWVEAWHSLPDLGTIAVADITYEPFSKDIVGGEPLWGSVFYEVRGFDRERAGSNHEHARMLRARAAEQVSGVWMRFAVSPHGAHSLHADVLTAVAESCLQRGDVVTMHLAESPEEVEFLRSGGGPFRDALERWGYWDDDWQAPGCSPVQYLKRLGLLRPELMAVHCVQLDDDDIADLAASGATACLCPRSNEQIGVGQPRVTDLLAAGVRCSIGTDGPASVDSLSLFDEMAFLRHRHPEVAPGDVLRMATINAARALRMDAIFGGLAPNKLGRFLVYRGDVGDNSVEAVTSGIDPDKLTWAGGDIDLRA